jgi:hypothetical protein
MPISEQQRKANVRLGLILATLALAFGLGFVARLVFLGH